MDSDHRDEFSPEEFRSRLRRGERVEIEIEPGRHLIRRIDTSDNGLSIGVATGIEIVGVRYAPSGGFTVSDEPTRQIYPELVDVGPFQRLEHLTRPCHTDRLESTR